MGKIIKRISHFVTKGIIMDSFSKPNETKMDNHEQQKKKNHEEVENVSQLTGTKKLREAINEEANYAVIPKKEYSEIIEKIKMKEITRLRRITEQRRDRRKKILPVLVTKVVDSSFKRLTNKQRGRM